MGTYFCPHCGGEVDMSQTMPVCMGCSVVWTDYRSYMKVSSDMRKTKAPDYLLEEFTDDLGKLILIAQRQFAEELIDSLDSTISEYKEWLDNRDNSWGEEWTRVDGGYRALKELCDGFKKALKGE